MYPGFHRNISIIVLFVVHGLLCDRFFLFSLLNTCSITQQLKQEVHLLTEKVMCAFMHVVQQLYLWSRSKGLTKGRYKGNKCPGFALTSTQVICYTQIPDLYSEMIPELHQGCQDVFILGS